MTDRKSRLLNVSKVAPKDAGATERLEKTNEALKQAAESIRSKVAQDRQHHRALVDSISDQAMRRSVAKDKK